jgi:hypothetical protein
MHGITQVADLKPSLERPNALASKGQTHSGV